MVNEQMKHKIKCSVKDIVIIGRKYKEKATIFTFLRPQFVTQIYMLRDLDTKIKQDLNINRCSPYYDPFLPSGFKLGYVTPNKENNCIQRYSYGGKEIKLNCLFLFSQTFQCF